jgi:hypothetical protein
MRASLSSTRALNAEVLVSPIWTASSSVKNTHLPGAAEFLQRLVDQERPFLVLTNSSIFTPATCPPG